MEDRFDLRLQPTGHHRLSDSVRDSRDAERPRATSVRFWYLHRLHRGREIATRGHPIPHPKKVILQVLLEVLDRATINPRRTLVGFHLPICFPHLPL
jgi:hypothetical protein